MSSLWVVDTNVLIVANGGDSDQADEMCQSKCEDFLNQVRNTKTLVLDHLGDILSEYGRHCSHGGQPGVGDMFFQWAFDMQHVHCERVPLTSTGVNSYEEFPSSSDLARFDPSDRKFAAVAIACKHATEVANAVDSDWCQHRVALENVGVQVTELCPSCLKALAD